MVPEPWDFPMKMILQPARFGYHLNDYKLNVCALKHLLESDVKNVNRDKKLKSH